LAADNVHIQPTSTNKHSNNNKHITNSFLSIVEEELAKVKKYASEDWSIAHDTRTRREYTQIENNNLGIIL
jgi:hypothetical protein